MSPLTYHCNPNKYPNSFSVTWQTLYGNSKDQEHPSHSWRRNMLVDLHFCITTHNIKLQWARHKTVEQNSESRNKSKHIWVFYLALCSHAEMVVFSENGAMSTRYADWQNETRSFLTAYSKTDYRWTVDLNGKSKDIFIDSR